MQQRNAAPAQRGAKEYDPTKDDENDDDRYPLFSRDEDENEDGKKDGDGDTDDNGNDGTGKDDSDDKDQKTSKAA